MVRSPAGSAAGHSVAEGHGVLGVESQPGQPGQDAQGRHAGASSQLARTGPEQRRVTPELVDHEAADGGAQIVRQQGHRPVQGGEHAAPIDVADDDRRQAGVAGHPEVDDVAVEEIDLRRAARPLAQDHVEAGPQVGELLHDQARQGRLGSW